MIPINKVFLVGNLTREPESRTTAQGISVCSFTIAVNNRRDKEKADFVRVTAWRQLGENCMKYLQKGKKVCVVGPVSVSTYEGKDGKTYASMEVTADDVEFLSPRDNVSGSENTSNDSGRDAPKGFTQVEDEEELPF